MEREVRDSWYAGSPRFEAPHFAIQDADFLVRYRTELTLGEC
jgi:uncharacterized protein (DUF2267 family)